MDFGDTLRSLRSHGSGTGGGSLGLVDLRAPDGFTGPGVFCEDIHNRELKYSDTPEV